MARNSSIIKAFGLVFVLFILNGCASHKMRTARNRLIPQAFRCIELGISKQQVIKSIGEPDIVRGSITNKFEQVIEVWEYSVDRGKDAAQIGAELVLTICTLGLCAPLMLSEGRIETYWLYFHTNKLVQWGKAGDWKKEADVISEIRFG